MARPRSLRQRVLIAFGVLTVVLVPVMLLSFHGVFHASEDSVFDQQLEEEVRSLLLQPERLRQPVVSIHRHLTAYVGLDGAPPSLRARLAPLKVGTYEWESLDAHVAVAPLPGRSERLYVVYDVSSVWHHRGVVYAAAVGLGLVLALLVSIGAGRALVGLVIRPVTGLARAVRAGPLETLGRRVEPADYGEEVSVLARALVEASDRLGAFVARERQFTANASHELRNPITVIKGAAELMESELGPEDASLRRPLARIQRAVTSMEETIEVFLALAREGELVAPPEGVTLAEVVAEIVEEHRRTIAGRPVAVAVQIPAGVQVTAPPRALAIVLANLIGNAFRRTHHGAVTIRWKDGAVEVEDTGPGLPAEIETQPTMRHVSSDEGHGLGLSIVSMLCERFGWALLLESGERSGTRAILRLSPQAA
jgi:signal transduction histidine kinase